MESIIEQVGKNAGKIWKTLNIHGPLTENQLLNQTDLSANKIHAAIGWLARENKIFKNEELFSLDESSFKNGNNKENIDQSFEENKIIEDKLLPIQDPVDTAELNSENIKAFENAIQKMDDETNNILDNNMSEITETEIETSENLNQNIIQNIIKTGEKSTKPFNPIPPWRRLENQSTGTCDLCKNEIEFEDNLSGLVIADDYFICESCCKNTPKDELMNWSKPKISREKALRPIGLWLVDKQNRDKSTFIV